MIGPVCPDAMVKVILDLVILSGRNQFILDTTGSPDPSSTTPIVPPTTPAGIDDPRCADGNNDYWPDVDCTKFIECYDGWGYLMECPSGLYFNPDDKHCEDPSISGCGMLGS